MRKSRLVLLLVFPFVVSCATTDNATGPTETKAAATLSILSNPQANDSLALAVALSLSSETLRLRLLDDLRDSPFPDHSIHLRSYLNGARGHDLMASLARTLGRSEKDFQKFEASFPQLTLQLDRTLDRVTWKGTPDLIVYAPTLQGEKQIIAGPTARGFTTDGREVSVPTWEAGPGPYLALRSTNINFGNDPEGKRRLGQSHAERRTVSTPEEERNRPEKALSASFTILPPPPCPPDCPSGGGPSPDGIALPSPYTAGYCFGWPAWGVPLIDDSNDTDHDGIKQDCEYQLAYQFRPQMARNSHEDAPDREPYWSVTRIPGSVTGVRIFYALSYYRDAGEHTTGWTSHDGDTEFVIVELENNMNNSNYRLWEMTSITLSAHWNSGQDRTATYAASDIEYPVKYRGRPRVWESWDKHANYRSKAVCNGAGWDTCTTLFTGTVYDDLEAISSANLGNEYDRTPPYTRDNILSDCVYSRKPSFGMPGYECYWVSQARDDLGWNASHGQEGATPYYNMFYVYGF